MFPVPHTVLSLLVSSSFAVLLERLEGSALHKLPEHRSIYMRYNLSTISPQFQLYDKPSDEPLHTIYWDQRSGPEPLHVQTSLNSGSRLIIVVHGFQESSDTEWVRDLTKLQSAYEGSVVMVVDWREGAKLKTAYSFLTDYTHATSYVPLMGAALASLVHRLMKTYEFHPDQVEFVGFSLGGQIGGYFTKFLMEREIKIFRFAALDVAAPGFLNHGIMPSKDHVQFLEVVHTSASDGSLIEDAEGLLGIDRDFGHVDFYPNGGRWQPGCSERLLTPCHHRRAHDLYVEALREGSCRLSGARCDSYKHALRKDCETKLSKKFAIGMQAHYCERGTPCIFNVPTSAESPFCHLQSLQDRNEV